MKTKPGAGTVVRMTGEFLRNTGQYTGPEGFNRWTIQACDCGLCRVGPFVLTDQPREDPAPDENKFRHINYHNLEKVPNARPR